ncbi:MAG: tol-pal system protein YbgF [Gemmatimonadales bacterium]|jgi:tol-pal system protein YbgF|nr:MAG: tol-pal system protein YbgF [Gemmatimonadales bacterium]
MLPITPSPARRVLILLAGVASVAGCATKQDVRDLREDMLSELQRIAAAQDSLRTEILRQSVQTQDTLRSASRELVDIRGDVLTTLNRLGSQLNRIQEMVGQNSLSISSLRDQMDALRRGGMVEGAGAEPGQVTGGQLSVGTGEADAMYNAAIRQFNRGSMSAARAAFEQFLTSYPSNDLAPAAHYYLADILVQEERLEEAVAAFAEIPELFPTSDRVPESLYRIGVLQVELGNEDGARAVLERLVNTYPEHPAAALARDLLAEIGGRRP